MESIREVPVRAQDTYFVKNLTVCTALICTQNGRAIPEDYIGGHSSSQEHRIRMLQTYL